MKRPFISGMDFSVSSGEIFGFLGPSEAGKSTLQKILIRMLRTYQGSAMVNGIECKRRTKNFYEDIGIDFEFSTMYERLTARENLQFFSSLYEKESRSIDELLEMAGLKQDADKRVSDYSKGMKSRLNLIKALLHDPLMLCLDEPASGLDPTNSRMMKNMILEGMAITKLSTLIMFGAVIPFFIKNNVQYVLFPLPSFWIGKAAYENILFYLFPTFALSVVWIYLLLKRYLRKTV